MLGSGGFASASVVSAIGATAGAVLTVAALAMTSGDPKAFFLCQAGISLVLSLVLRSMAWRRIGGPAKVSVRWSKIRTFWAFSAGMGGISIATLILTQADKIILSRLLTLADFGRYTLASTVASSIYLVLTPAFNFFYPRMASLVAKNDSTVLVGFYSQGTRLLATVLFPLVVSMAANAEPLLTVWTGDRALGASVGPLAALLLIGTACNGVMHFPYALQLAYGEVRLPFTISISLAFVSIPLLALLTWKFGVIGSASTWLITNVAYVFLGSWLTHRRLLKGRGPSWLLEDVATPLLTTLVVVAPGWLIASQISLASHRVGFAIAVGCLSLFANLLLLPRDSRINLWRQIRA
jgi:O-antigen/teichoic acid export membrane protein